MIGRSLTWARSQKHGSLKGVFLIYRWMRLSILPLLYQAAIAAWPRRVESYAALARILEQKYAFMISGHGRNLDKAAKLGQRAVDCLQRVVEIDPERLGAFHACSSLLFSLGRADESLRMFARGLDVQRALAERHQLDKLGIRFVAPVMATGGIGLLVHLDAYVKARLLDPDNSAPPIILVTNRERVSNPHFLVYWHKHITVVSDPSTVERLLPLAEAGFCWFPRPPYSWISGGNKRSVRRF